MESCFSPTAVLGPEKWSFAFLYASWKTSVTACTCCKTLQTSKNCHSNALHHGSASFHSWAQKRQGIRFCHCRRPKPHPGGEVATPNSRACPQLISLKPVAFNCLGVLGWGYAPLPKQITPKVSDRKPRSSRFAFTSQSRAVRSATSTGLLLLNWKEPLRLTGYHQYKGRERHASW